MDKLFESNDPLFTTNEAMSLLRCSRVFLWRERKEGKIKCISLGRKILFQKSAIDNYLKAQSVFEKEESNG